MAKLQNPLGSPFEFVRLNRYSEKTFPFDMWMISTYNHTDKEPSRVIVVPEYAFNH
jgi:hypothetical protein